MPAMARPMTAWRSLTARRPTPGSREAMASSTQARQRRGALVLVVAAATTTAVAGCGGAAKTVSVSGQPATARTATTATNETTGTRTAKSASTTPPATPTTGGTAAGSSASTPAESQTRTASEPAFAEREKSSGGSSAGSEGLEAALAVVRAHGFVVKDTSTYDPEQTLRVLVGAAAASGEGYEEQAFFFVEGRYIGTDASSASAQISVVSQSDTEVTLAYGLYRPGDSLCCPGGGQAKVRFQLNNGTLMALDPIPPVSSSTGLSRR